MSSSISIKLITHQNTHLWEDALFFLEQAIQLSNGTDTWHLGTYARGSLLFAVSAFEASCGILFQDRDFSNKGGILNGIDKKLRKKYGLACFNIEDTPWDAVRECLNYRNTFTHGKKDQSGLFIDYREPARTACTLLHALKELYLLTGVCEEKWISEYWDTFNRYSI